MCIALSFPFLLQQTSASKRPIYSSLLIINTAKNYLHTQVRRSIHNTTLVGTSTFTTCLRPPNTEASKNSCREAQCVFQFHPKRRCQLKRHKINPAGGKHLQSLQSNWVHILMEARTSPQCKENSSWSLESTLVLCPRSKGKFQNDLEEIWKGELHNDLHVWIVASPVAMSTRVISCLNNINLHLPLLRRVSMHHQRSKTDGFSKHSQFSFLRQMYPSLIYINLSSMLSRFCCHAFIHSIHCPPYLSFSWMK